MLMMVRTGAASPELIKLIMNYFKELDEDGSGSLSLDEICQSKKLMAAPTKEKEELVWAIKQREEKIIQKQARRFSGHLMQPIHKRMSGLSSTMSIPDLSGTADGADVGDVELEEGRGSTVNPVTTISKPFA
jgi:hypothetical protein